MAKTPRTTVYDWRKDNPDFADRWNAARQIGAEALEDEAIRRAHDGVVEPVFYQGVKVGEVRRYSDTLLMFLLKGAKPEKYKDRVAAEHSGPAGQPIEFDDAQAAKRIEEILSAAKSRLQESIPRA